MAKQPTPARRSVVKDSLTSTVAGIPAPKSTLTTYTMPAVFNQQEYLAAYRTSAIVQRLIRAIPEDATRKWRDWQADADQITDIEDVEKLHGYRAKVEEWMWKGNLLGEAYLVIDDGMPPETQLVPGQGEIQYFIVMSKSELGWGEIEVDPISPNYQLPRYYTLNTTSRGVLNIHPSRVAVWKGYEDPISREGRSILDYTLTPAKYYDNTMQNIQSMTFEAKVDVLSVSGLMQDVQDPELERAIQARYALFNLMKGVHGTAVIDKDNEEFQQKQLSFATLPDIIDRMQQHVAMAWGSPVTMLFGKSSGGLGSTGNLELSTHYENIQTLQDTRIRPTLALFDECIIWTALGARPEDVHYRWASLHQVTDKERAEIGKIIADTAKVLSDGGIVNAATLNRPVINALTEAGAMPGLDQSQDDFDAGLIEPADTPDESGADLPEDDAEDTLQA